MADDLVSEYIVLFSTALFVYWSARAFLIVFRSEARVNEVLARDLWWARRIWISLFRPPTALLSLWFNAASFTICPTPHSTSPLLSIG